MPTEENTEDTTEEIYVGNGLDDNSYELDDLNPNRTAVNPVITLIQGDVNLENYYTLYRF